MRTSRFGRNGVAGLTAALVGLALAAATGRAASQDAATTVKAEQPAAVRAKSALPVILLTGFEPFGKKKPPNPSWEGIKKLDGQEWKGFRLVAKQLPVVWGSPLTQLEGWIAEYKPVAVFSLGQGGEGGFSIESWAYNRRAAEAEDNLKNKPSAADIVADGPKRFDATIDSLKLAKALAEKGYHVNVSTDAGRYLCEETLYSLEYLKSARKIDGSVLFCHVPPLGSKLTKTKFVTEDYVENFAKDLLETWRDADQNPQAAAPVAVAAVAAVAAQPSPAASAREQDVKSFIEHYFKSWSDQDMDAYDDCFMADACIQYIDTQGQLFTTPRQRFVAGQREVHRRSSVRSIEVPESIEIRFEQKIARVVAYWRLNAGARVQKGYDHFTLKQERGKWRIVNLLFYSTSDNGQD
ncbi:nuclear transport factor 2 family protein [Paludisphaera borealis]|uniref:Pyrrolidone-carboxylate peptidase n=1 Tax=Paludisphaera borealis TaxID=1387353 RepID=A0A1U7CX68_9BACT|nr:nuclear transport factor 2 family protein [Paludisphaera borealis]APW63488.1 Pyrrolidone-carboxylate peptidase [Paludisphaera borealis]